MSGHPVFDAVEHAVLTAAREWATVEDHIAATLHHKTPAQMPATMAAATARPEENPVSLATLEAELGQRIASAEAAVHAEIGKLVADLPGLTAEAKQFAATPLGQLAVTAAQHVAAGVLPPEALAIVESGAAKLYGDILSLYNPQGAQQAPAAPPAQ